jgi:hypothetical protein
MSTILRFLARPVHLHLALPFNTTIYLTVDTFLAGLRLRLVGGYLDTDLRNTSVAAGVGLLSVVFGYYQRYTDGC